MKTKVTGLVLRPPVKHNDRSDILNVLSPQHGRLGVVVPAGGGRTARIRKAALMPLSIIEFQLPASVSSIQLSRASSITSVYTYKTLYFDPVKRSIVMLLSEFLNRFLRDATPDELMYRYISDSVILLDDLTDERRLANFPIAFLSGLATFAGVTPDVSAYSAVSVFDMSAGRYTTMLPPHRNILRGEEARLPLLLVRMNYANQHRFRFTRTERRRILDGILQYFGLHFPGVDNINSPDVLFGLFD